jgi:hypothetical protein
VDARLIGRTADDTDVILGTSSYSSIISDAYYVASLLAPAQTDAAYVSYWVQTYDSGDEGDPATLFDACTKVQIAIPGPIPTITSLTCNRPDCLARRTQNFDDYFPDLAWTVRFNGENLPQLMGSYGAGYIQNGFHFTPSEYRDFVRSLDATQITIGTDLQMFEMPSNPLYWLDIAGIRFSGQLPIRFVPCFPGTGKIMSGNTWNGQCAACTGNTYTSAATNYRCVACSAGTISNAEKTGCDPAPPTEVPLCAPNQLLSVSKCFDSNEPRVSAACTTSVSTTADAACGSAGGQGFCVAASRCSCASGHGAKYDATSSSFLCSVAPPGIGGKRATLACDPLPVDPTGSSFGTQVQSFAYNNGLIDLTITAPYEDSLDASNRAGATTLTFGDGSGTGCDYPAGATNLFVPVAATEGACYDSYTATLVDWAVVKNCGPWTSQPVGDNIEFSTIVTVSRDYSVTQGRISTTRTASSTHYLAVSFPSVGSVDSSTTVTIFGGAPDLQNNMVLSSIRYDIARGIWVAKFKSSTVYPYTLSPISNYFSVIESNTGNEVAYIADIGDCQAPVPNAINDQCIQTITVEFNPGCSALEFINGNYLFVEANTIQYQCLDVAVTNNNCPISGALFVSTTTETMRINNLATSSACPDTRIDIAPPTAQFFSTAGDYNTAAAAFIQGDQIPFKLSLTAATVAGRTDTITNTRIIDVTVTTLAGGTALKGTPSVASTGNYIDKITAPSPCSAVDRACFVVNTAASPFDGAEAVGEGQARQHTFRVTYEVTYAGSGKKRYTVAATAPMIRGASATDLTLRRRASQPISQAPSASGTTGTAPEANFNVVIWVLVAVIAALVVGAAVGIFIWKYRARAQAKKDLL